MSVHICEFQYVYIYIVKSITCASLNVERLS